MKRSLLLFFVLSVVSISSISASDTKIKGRLFANWNLDTSEGAESANSFNLKRAYVTVTSKLNDNTTVRITSDLRQTDTFDGYSIILKYGYLDWKPAFASANLNLRFGLQPTLFIDHMNKLWGRRYLEKTVGDKNKYLTTSDLGFSGSFKLGEKGKLGYLALQFLNGTSYSDVKELNKNKDISGFVQLKPLTNNETFKRTQLLAQFYNGTQNEIIDTTEAGSIAKASAYKKQILSVGAILDYDKLFDIGVDLNFKTNGDGYSPTGLENPEIKSNAKSFFGTFYLQGTPTENSFLKTINIFGRYDMYDPNTNVDDDGKSLLIVGVETNPTKGLKTSLNIRTTSYELDGKQNNSYLYINTMYKF